MAAALIAGALLSWFAMGCDGSRTTRADAAGLATTLHDLLALHAREQALLARESALSETLRQVPDPPADGCVPVRLGTGHDLTVRMADDPQHCGDAEACRQPAWRIAAVQEKPRACTGEVCRYLGHLAYLLLRRDGGNEDVIIYQSVRDAALFDGSDRICELVGVRIDTVSGSFRQELEPAEGVQEYTFDKAPVIVVFGYRSEDRERKRCTD